MKKIIFFILLLIFNFEVLSQSGWQLMYGGSYFPPSYYQRIQFTDNQTGWLNGNRFTKKTTNGGANWIRTDSIGSAVSFFLNNNTGWVLQSDGVYRTLSGGSSWVKINNSNYSAAAVYFLDDQNGYLSSPAGIVRRTTNGGINWDSIYTGISDDLKDIYFTSVNKGYAAGDWGTILRTTNSGINWIRYFDINMSFFNDISFINQQTGFACGTGGFVLRTTNEGVTWQSIYTGSGAHLLKTEFTSGGIGYLFGVQGELWKSSDIGLTWNLQPSNIPGKVSSACITPSGNLWAAVDTGKVLRSTNGASSWETNLSQYFTFSNLNSVKFFNSNTGWVCGLERKLYKTVNGGINWIPMSTGADSTCSFLSMLFINSTTGFICGSINSSTGFIFRTTNEGLNWQTTYQDTFQVNTMTFLNNSTGWAAGNSGTILRTTNGGLNWSVNRPLTSNLFRIHFIDVNTGFVTGSGVRRTTNGGLNWSITGAIGNYISFPNAQTGYILNAGTNSSISKTTDSGMNWVNFATGTPSGSSILFINSEKGWIGGNIVKITTNGGVNWTLQHNLESGIRINAFSFINEYEGWAVGYYGTLLKTNSGGIGISQISTELPEDFSLNQNFPNPFNPITKIRFAVTNQIGKGGPVTLKVYDLLGRLVTTLVNQDLDPGIYETEWNASEFSSGVYLYTLSTGSFRQTKKMVLIK